MTSVWLSRWPNSARKDHRDQGEGKDAFSIAQMAVTSARPARRMRSPGVISF